MGVVTFTEEEKSRIRYHLGYPQTLPVASIVLGVPHSNQSQFLVETQMERIPDTAVSFIRACVAKCDSTEQRILDCQERMAAKSIDEVDLNPEEANMLRIEYRYWVKKLSDNLGAPLNPFASAFQGGTPPLNVAVIH